MNIGRAVMSMALLYFIYHFISMGFSDGEGYSLTENSFFSIISIISVILLIKAPLEALVLGCFAYTLLFLFSNPFTIDQFDTFLYIYITSICIAIILGIPSVVYTYKLETLDLSAEDKRKRTAKLWMDIGRGVQWFYYLILLLFSINLILIQVQVPSAPYIVFPIMMSVIVLVFCQLLYFRPFIGYVVSTIFLIIILLSVIAFTPNNTYTPFSYIPIVTYISLALVALGLVNTYRYKRYIT